MILLWCLINKYRTKGIACWYGFNNLIVAASDEFVPSPIWSDSNYWNLITLLVCLYFEVVENFVFRKWGFMQCRFSFYCKPISSTANRIADWNTSGFGGRFNSSSLWVTVMCDISGTSLFCLVPVSCCLTHYGAELDAAMCHSSSDYNAEHYTFSLPITLLTKLAIGLIWCSKVCNLVFNQGLGN